MRRPPRVLAAIASAVALAIAALVVAGPFPRGDRAAAAPFLQIEAAHAEHVPALDGDATIFVLLIGSDARPGEVIDGVRADSIHIVSFDPPTGRSAILGFPRDSWVEIPGVGTSKINDAMARGGPELLVQTVEALTGITIDYWALTWFEGFQQMVNDIGGITIDIPFAMEDPTYSRASFEPGVQTIDGRQALAFARDRHSLPMGDFGRSENQGRLILAALEQLHARFADDLGSILTYLAAGLRSTRTSLPFDEVLRLAFVAATVDATAIENVVVPGDGAMVGGYSVVQIAPEAEALFADLAADGYIEPLNLPPSPNASLLD